MVACPEPIKTFSEPVLMVAPQVILSPFRAALAPSIKTVSLPCAISCLASSLQLTVFNVFSGGVAKAAGNPLINTFTAPFSILPSDSGEKLATHSETDSAARSEKDFSETIPEVMSAML